jgi:hypothetical protein
MIAAGIQARGWPGRCPDMVCTFLHVRNGGASFLAGSNFWKVWVRSKARARSGVSPALVTACRLHESSATEALQPRRHFTALCQEQFRCRVVQDDVDTERRGSLPPGAGVRHPNRDPARHPLTMRQRCSLCTQHRPSAVQIIPPNPVIRLFSQQPRAAGG